MVSSISEGSSSTSRISTLLVVVMGFHIRNGEEEGCALVRLRLGPDSASVLVDDPLNRHESNSGAFKIPRLVQALKNTEELAGILHFEPDAVVPNEVNKFLVERRHSGVYHCAIARTRVFDRVRKEVHEHLTHQVRIAIEASQIIDPPFDIATLRFRPEVLAHHTDQIIQRRNPRRQRLAADPGEIEQIVDQSSHALRAVLYPLQIPLAVLIQIVGVLLNEDIGEARDLTKWGAQVVRNRVGKRV